MDSDRILDDSGWERAYLCIDLKCFYASVECADRDLDPFADWLIVADETRGESTICLSVSPALKAQGLSSRCRLREIPQRFRRLIVPPRMRRYMEVSSDVYAVYLRFISAQDIHVYSIDECFIDVTPYLHLYNTTPRQMARMLLDAVRDETHIYATVGVGSNLFLAKVALDLVAKHSPDRIGVLDEEEFKQTVWTHRPITDIWNIGPGTARRLQKYNVYDLAGVTFLQPEVLYREFGVNAQYLIDHAWGREPCTIAQIKQYVPKGHALFNSQVLFSDYTVEDALVIVQEMVDNLVLEMVEKHLVSNHISLAIGYTFSTVADNGQTGGSRTIAGHTNSYRKLLPAFEELYAQAVRHDRPIRNISVGVDNLLPECFARVDLFCDLDAEEREHRLQETVLSVKGKFGKNALIKGRSLKESATACERNLMIGGHRA